MFAESQEIACIFLERSRNDSKFVSTEHPTLKDVTHLYLVYIADSMIKLYWTTLIQVCLSALKNVRANTSQVVHRPRASCGTRGRLQ